MKKQEYILKKYVWATSAAEALALDQETKVSEAHLTADTPGRSADAVGFKFVETKEHIPLDE